MRIQAFVVFALLALTARVRAQPPPELKLEVQKLSDTLYLLSGPGGNIALFVGNNGVFLVDDQIAPLTPKLKQVIAQITPKPVRFIVNTHWHRDHTGGNPTLGAEGAVIVAHDNVRKRLSTEQLIQLFNRKVPPMAPEGLPVITFAQSLSFHIDGEDIDVIHVDPAHTDGDAIVHFRKANVIHTGDVYTSAGYPFIDLSSGGTADGAVRAVDQVLGIAQANTRIIPGHGSITDKIKLKVWRDVVATIRDRVKKLVAEGKSLADVQASKPSAEYDAAWGGAFIKGPQLVESIYKDLTRKP
jgi:glyoxylase-like metal-dependent hydrolase (beta-lactamase superfamily II)